MDHTVTYRFGRDDYIALLRAHRLTSPLGGFGRWGRYGCFGVFSVVLINLFYYESWWGDPVGAVFGSTVIFVVIVVVAPVGEFIGEQILALWIYPRRSVANKDCTLELDDGGIQSKYGDIEGRLPWRTIARILETKDYFFLFISRAETILVPKRALPSPDAVTELRHYIRCKVDAAATG